MWLLLYLLGWDDGNMNWKSTAHVPSCSWWCWRLFSSYAIYPLRTYTWGIPTQYIGKAWLHTTNIWEEKVKLYWPLRQPCNHPVVVVEETGQDVEDGGFRQDEFLQMQDLDNQIYKSINAVKTKESLMLYLEVLGTELMPIHINSW